MSDTATPEKKGGRSFSQTITAWCAAALSAVTSRATTVLDVIGAGLLVTAAAMIWVPAAFAFAGVVCLLISWRASR